MSTIMAYLGWIMAYLGWVYMGLHETWYFFWGGILLSVPQFLRHMKTNLRKKGKESKKMNRASSTCGCTEASLLYQ